MIRVILILEQFENSIDRKFLQTNERERIFTRNGAKVSRNESTCITGDLTSAEN